MSNERRSPFPGMDPYLEQYWEDVHLRLIANTADALFDQLPSGLIARVDQRVYVDEEVQTASVRKPDVRVVESPVAWEQRPIEYSAGQTAVPVLLEVDVDPVTERFIRIMDTEGHRIVTSIEFLSPKNKRSGAGKRAYLRKREEFINSDANLVEIDLVRAGNWKSMLGHWVVPAPFHTTYRVTIKRADRLAKPELYPIRLNQRLPVIPIPLRQGEKDVTLDLQSLIDQIYHKGHYETIDYTQACEPALKREEAEFAEQVIRARNL